MSKPQGHWTITRQAVRELADDQRGPNPPPLPWWLRASLPAAAVAPDIRDLLCLGHWADFGQRRHFMRRFDGQSPLQAYLEAVEWIRRNALEAAGLISLAAAGAPPGSPRQAPPPLAGPRLAWALGGAAHALEDSFAGGHVTRATPAGRWTPGAIEHVKVYAGGEKAGHHAADEAWRLPGGGLSVDGRLAVDAVKGLLLLVAATGRSRPGTRPTSLLGWVTFQDRWLKASPGLSGLRGREFGVIARLIPPSLSGR